MDSLVWQSEPAWVKDVRADYLQRLSDFPGPRADGGAGLVDFKPPPEKRPRMAVANLIS